MSFSARARVRGVNGLAYSAKTAYIQKYYNGSWRTIKKLSLDSTGRAKWSYRISSKRKYRLYVKRTNDVHGMLITLPRL